MGQSIPAGVLIIHWKTEQSPQGALDLWNAYKETSHVFSGSEKH